MEIKENRIKMENKNKTNKIEKENIKIKSNGGCKLKLGPSNSKQCKAQHVGGPLLSMVDQGSQTKILI